MKQLGSDRLFETAGERHSGIWQALPGRMIGAAILGLALIVLPDTANALRSDVYREDQTFTSTNIEGCDDVVIRRMEESADFQVEFRNRLDQMLTPSAVGLPLGCLENLQFPDFDNFSFQSALSLDGILNAALDALLDEIENTVCSAVQNNYNSIYQNTIGNAEREGKYFMDSLRGERLAAEALQCLSGYGLGTLDVGFDIDLPDVSCEGLFGGSILGTSSSGNATQSFSPASSQPRRAPVVVSPPEQQGEDDDELLRLFR